MFVEISVLIIVLGVIGFFVFKALNDKPVVNTGGGSGKGPGKGSDVEDRPDVEDGPDVEDRPDVENIP